MLKVGDIMHKGEANPFVEKDTCFREVLEVMDAKKWGAVSVVDSGKLVGIITDGDIRRLLLKTQLSLPNLFLVNAERIMTKNPKTISPDCSLKEGLERLERHLIWVLPVVDAENNLLGLLHMQTLLRAMIGEKR